MKMILTVLAVMALLIGMAGALPKLGANQGFSNPGSMELGGGATISGNAAVGGNLAVTGSITAGGGSSANGVFSQDLSMAAGYDFRTAVGASVFDWSNGTGLFKTTTGPVTIGGGTNGITLNGPVAGISAKDWTMVGASKLTIGSTGIQAVGGTITFLNNTSFSGAITSSSGTFSGTVQAEQLTSTDDASVNDDLTVLGKVDVTETVTAEQLTSTDDATIGDAMDVVGALTAGSMASDAGITAVTTIQGEQLTSTDDAKITDALEVDGSAALNGTTIASGAALAVTTADKLTVGSVIVPQYWDFNVQNLNAASVDMNVAIPTSSWKIISVKEVHSVVATGNPTITIKKCTGTQAPGSGAAMLAAAFNLSTPVETIVTGTPNTDGSQKINATERLVIDFTGAPTALVGGTLTFRMQRI